LEHEPGDVREKLQFVESYQYVDELGYPLYQVVRFEPKTFRQRRADGKGGWISGLGDTVRVLYRLDRVATAAMHGDVVYVVEGERDVHSLEKVDPAIVATCNPMGAGKGKWLDSYSEHMRGARVTIIARAPRVAGGDGAARRSLAEARISIGRPGRPRIASSSATSTSYACARRPRLGVYGAFVVWRVSWEDAGGTGAPFGPTMATCAVTRP
jgi:hypothetical protein